MGYDLRFSVSMSAKATGIVELVFTVYNTESRYETDRETYRPFLNAYRPDYVVWIANSTKSWDISLICAENGVNFKHLVLTTNA